MYSGMQHAKLARMQLHQTKMLLPGIYDALLGGTPCALAQSIYLGHANSLHQPTLCFTTLALNDTQPSLDIFVPK